MQDLHAEFLNPSSQWRAKPFWAWNGELNSREIECQIVKFKEMGFGGFFIHSRVGLVTPFLGQEWFDCVDAAVEKGKSIDMEAWLYDEDRWPSGTAGGLVTLDHRFRAKRLHCLRTKGDSIPPKCLAAFRYHMENGKLVSYERILPNDSPGDDEDVLVFAVRTGWTSDEDIGFYNGQCYLDTLNPEAVNRFLQISYEPYLRFSAHFGKTIKGFFTDEPNRGAFLGTHPESNWHIEGNQYQIPWTEAFPEEFEKRMGYRLTEYLPEVFFDTPFKTSSVVRWQVSEICSQLFVEAYADQISQWCELHDLSMTGHILGEESLYMLMWGCGVNGRFYEKMQAPGIDLINELVDYTVPKQLDSSARQFNKRWRLCEMYANSGWNYSLAQYKAYGDWNAALGVNLRCPHLSLYSMAGQRKRDCPPSISYQQHWHADYKAVEDHFARLGMMLSNGRPDCSILILHPLDSVSGMLRPGWVLRRKNSGIEEMTAADDAFHELTRQLISFQLDFDYTEEHTLAHSASLIDEGEKAYIKIGDMKYDTVIVPPVPSLRRSTFLMLTEFSKNKGTVYFCPQGPDKIDWASDENMCAFLKSASALAIDRDVLKRQFAAKRRVLIEEPQNDGRDILSRFCTSHSHDVLFLVNSSQQNAYRFAVNVKTDGQVQLWDTREGTRRAVPYVKTDGSVRFYVSLAPTESQLYVIAREAEEIAVLRQPSPSIPLSRFTCWDTAPITLSDPNILLLDRPELFLDGLTLPACHILRQDEAVRRRLGLAPRSNTMYQPWFRKTRLSDTDSVKHCPVRLDYRFDAVYIPNGPMYLAMEQPERFTLFLNGRQIPTQGQADGYYADKSIKKLRISPTLLAQGENLLSLRCEFNQDIDLEAIYLMGDFGVLMDGFRLTISSPPTTLKYGSVLDQGLPFYSGTILYRPRFDLTVPSGQIMLEVPDFNGIALRVSEKDFQEPSILPWPPYQKVLKSFEALTVHLVCGMGNSLGVCEHGENGYTLSPQGILTPPIINIYE